MILNLNKKENLYCPICKEKLIIDGTIRYIDCCNTTNISDKYICKNNKCYLYNNSYWNDYGDYFSLNHISFEKKFGHTKYAALNSFAKKIEIEIYKKGLKDKTYLSPLLTLLWLKPYIEHNYKADKWGNILKKTYKLKFLKKQKDSKEYNIYYISGIKMFFFSLKQFKIKYKKYLNNKTENIIYEIYNEFNDNWDKRNYKKLYKKYIKIRYFHIINNIKKEYNFYKKLNKYRYKKITENDFNELLKICPNNINLIYKLKNISASGKILDNFIRKEKLLAIL